MSTALISVSDKTSIVELAQALLKLGVNILSTGGTYKLLDEQGIAAKQISQHTGYPEIMNGRVKSLHPKIHGGILARRGTDTAVMQEHDIAAIDIVVVNLYPFADTIAQEDCTPEQAIEQIDIGGPTLVRAAAKNHRDVAILTDPADYSKVIEELEENGAVSADTKLYLAQKAFALIAQYDISIANYFANLGSQIEQLPSQIFLSLQGQAQLPYGENPHQRAAVYTANTSSTSFNICNAQQLQGKSLSYNNLNDAYTAFSCVNSFEQDACVIVKHANPCGVAVADNCLEAYKLAYATDTVSAFGGIIAFNRTLDLATVEKIIDNQFVELIIAPKIYADASALLAEKRPKVRLLVHPDPICKEASKNDLHLKALGSNCYLAQSPDNTLADEMKCVTKRQPSNEELRDLKFAWQVAGFVKSNAIVYAKGEQTIGVGAGQMSRIDSAKIAAIKAQEAGLSIEGSAMASDAFFPFRDSVDAAAKAGVTAIVQPGGSIRDQEVIDAANENNIAMVFTGKRHFLH